MSQSVYLGTIMAKDKTAKGEKGFPNKHLHTRVSFLFQAAAYLSLRTKRTDIPPMASSSSTRALPTDDRPAIEPDSALALQLVSHLRAVSLKGQVRLSPEMKRAICKRCNTVLIPGRTSTAKVENKSRGGAKPWADMVIVGCNSCGSQKRFPVGSQRQVRKKLRCVVQDESSSSVHSSIVEQTAQLATETKIKQQQTS